MQFYGANEARGGKLVRLVAHKVAGGVIESMGLIGNEFGAGSVPGALLRTRKAQVGLLLLAAGEVSRGRY